MQGRWQPIIVTINSQEGGEALTGEVTASLESSVTGMPLGSWTMPVTLPRGAGTVRTTATVFVPERAQPDLLVLLRRGRNGRGDVIARRTYRAPRLSDASLTLLAVTASPDALSYLRGETLGVENSAGVLRRAADTPGGRSPNQTFRQRSAAAAAVRVENLPDAGLLPGTAAGYDTIAILYLGTNVGPSQFSDAQAASLRGWVTGGGLLVTDSPSLRSDERFRTWIPTAPAAEASGIEANRIRLGRGLVATVSGNITEAGFARSEGARTFWRELAQDTSAEPLLGNLIQGRGLSFYSPQAGFWQCVIRAPGLKAPPSSAIALFLVVYLLLLIPVNYFLLKRLDRREWTWVTVPILVTIFSIGAYVFGYALKGTRMLQNTVTLCEMGSNRGDAVVTASIGVFSPRQTSYDLSSPFSDTVFWSPEAQGRYDRSAQGYGPLEVAMPGETGADSAVHVRNANISMWAMRVFAARTYQVKLGDGIAARLAQDGSDLSGIVRNSTGRPLEHVWLTFGGSQTFLGALAPGQQKSVRLKLPSRGRNSGSSSVILQPASALPTSGVQEFQRPILSAVASAREFYRQSERDQQITASGPAAVLSAWNHEEMFPVKIDGRSVPTGTNINLITVSIPVEGK